MYNNMYKFRDNLFIKKEISINNMYKFREMFLHSTKSDKYFR